MGLLVYQAYIVKYSCSYDDDGDDDVFTRSYQLALSTLTQD